MEKFEKITQLNAEVKQIKGTRTSKPLFLMHMISKFIVQPVTEFQVVSVTVFHCNSIRNKIDFQLSVRRRGFLLTLEIQLPFQ